MKTTSGGRVRSWVLLAGASFMTAAIAVAQAPSKSSSPAVDQAAGGSLDPATFIRINEVPERGERELPIYHPKSGGMRQLTADYASMIVVSPDLSLMGNDPILNNLFMQAELVSGDKRTNLEVVGYSEVGQSQEASLGQRGMAFESAENLAALVRTLASRVCDMVSYSYQTDVDCQYVDLASEEIRKADEEVVLSRFEDRLRLYRAELNRFGEFFTDARNETVAQIIGPRIFKIDSGTLKAIADDFGLRLEAILGGDLAEAAKRREIKVVWSRTKLAYARLQPLWMEIDGGAGISAKEVLEPGQTFADRLARNGKRLQQEGKEQKKKRQEARDLLGRFFVPGTISLGSAKAEDGDTLILRVEARGADSAQVGIPALFEIDIKRYGAQAHISPSFLFIKRLNISESDLATGPDGVAAYNDVNFAPSPGLTFGVTFLNRGQSGGARVLRALGPGIGVNVSFMNFHDPSFDLAENKFVNTSGQQVQVGAGVIGSLFDNKLQFSYGWNLNAPAKGAGMSRKRNYFAIGFGFLEVSKLVADFVK